MTSSAHAAYRDGRCRVYALDVEQATGMRLHAAYTPCEWRHNQFASDVRLQQLVARHDHPWLVHDARAADVIVLTGHGFSRWCVAQTILRDSLNEQRTTWNKGELSSHLPSKLCGNESSESCGAPQDRACHLAGRLFRSETAKRQLWRRMTEAADWLNASAPRVLVYLNNECPPAWAAAAATLKQTGTHLLVDRINARIPDKGRWIVPFVVSRPAWLLGDAAVPAEHASNAPWAERKLLLFAGHVPKLYISQTRYQLWRAWRRETARVSVYTKDISCSLRAYTICRTPSRWEAEHDTFCRTDCNTQRLCKTVASLKRECAAYRRVRWEEELPDVNATNRGLSRAEYLTAAMSHRFCVVAPGDYPSTPKITEFVAVGAAGGCLPVVVVPSPVVAGARAMLPYAESWLDYCDIVAVIPESAVRNSTAMRAVLDRLDSLTAADAARWRRALLRVRDAFVTRERGALAGAPPRISATDFLLREACALASRRPRDSLSPSVMRPMDRCLLAREVPASRGWLRPVRPSRPRSHKNGTLSAVPRHARGARRSRSG